MQRTACKHTPGQPPQVLAFRSGPAHWQGGQGRQRECLWVWRPAGRPGGRAGRQATTVAPQHPPTRGPLTACGMWQQQQRQRRQEASRLASAAWTPCNPASQPSCSQQPHPAASGGKRAQALPTPAGPANPCTLSVTGATPAAACPLQVRLARHATPCQQAAAPGDPITAAPPAPGAWGMPGGCQAPAAAGAAWAPHGRHRARVPRAEMAPGGAGRLPPALYLSGRKSQAIWGRVAQWIERWASVTHRWFPIGRRFDPCLGCTAGAQAIIRCPASPCGPTAPHPWPRSATSAVPALRSTMERPDTWQMAAAAESWSHGRSHWRCARPTNSQIIGVCLYMLARHSISSNACCHM